MSLKDLFTIKEAKQEYLATCLGVKQQTISSWCKGRTKPTVEIIPKLSKILNCTIEELVYAIINTKGE